MAQKSDLEKRVLTIPNLITLLRLVVFLPLVAYLVSHEEWGWGLTIYLLGAASDKLDGLVARRLNQITKLGKALDPLADKIYLLGIPMLFLKIPTALKAEWTLLVMLELFLLTIGALAYFQKKNQTMEVAANRWGKIKAALEVLFGALLFIGPIGLRINIYLLAAILTLAVASASLSIRGHLTQYRNSIR